MLASSMAFIDGSALTVALPALRADLDASVAGIQWVINAYVLGLAALTLIGGALADTYGKARILVAGIGLFAVASVACALASTAEALIAARAVQGVGAALLTPASLALIGAVYPEDERAGAIGVWASASALTTAGGPILGGLLVESFGWASIFWMNLPLAAAATWLAAPAIRFDVGKPQRFDVLGASILALGLAAATWGLSALGGGEAAAHGLEAQAAAGSRRAWIALAVGAALLVAFIWVERRAPAPMAPPAVLARPVFAALNGQTFLLYAALSVVFFVLPFDLVEERGLTATQAGAAFLPFTLGVGLLSRPFGALADTIGVRASLRLGSGAAALGFAGLGAGGLADAGFAIGVAAPMGLLGIGFAMVVAPLTAAVMSSAPRGDEGLASGVNTAVSRMAQLIGVAAAGALLVVPFGLEIGMFVAAALALAAAALAPKSRANLAAA